VLVQSQKFVAGPANAVCIAPDRHERTMVTIAIGLVMRNPHCLITRKTRPPEVLKKLQLILRECSGSGELRQDALASHPRVCS
jgi:hypothetical protein